MSLQHGRLMFCLLLAIFTHSQGLQFSKDTTSDSVYCGHLYCWVDIGITDTGLSSIVNLAVYDVTHANRPVKLASLSVFDPDLYVRQTEIAAVNVTGNISIYNAELTLRLRDRSYCYNGSFMCELDYMNINGQPQVVRETVSPGSSINCHAVETENVYLKEEVSRLQTIVNSSRDLSQATCFKGMYHSKPIEQFLLWGKVAALCDTETDGGGWIIIQRRTKGDVDFFHLWDYYKTGFGTPDTDFWIGNDVIHNLTSQGYTELRIDMTYLGKQYFAHYSDFYVAAETSLYRLSVSGYNGTAGDGLAPHDGRSFSTLDRDNDANSDNCPSLYHGAWWYNNCGNSNLNGKWGASDGTGLVWPEVSRSWSVSVSEMKVRHM